MLRAVPLSVSVDTRAVKAASCPGRAVKSAASRFISGSRVQWGLLSAPAVRCSVQGRWLGSCFSGRQRLGHWSSLAAARRETVTRTDLRSTRSGCVWEGARGCFCS